MSEANPITLHHGYHADPVSGVCYRTLTFLGHPGYRVGDDGTLWSRRRNGRGNYLNDFWVKLKLSNNCKDGYYYLNFSYKRVRKRLYIHRLVLLAFVGPCPERMQACHAPDRSVSNNHIYNLRWDTSMANHKDCERDGMTAKGERVASAKFTTDSVLQLREDFATGLFTITQLAKRLKISRTACSMVIRRKHWKHI
jgi:hypothetical protein